ncbi:hypothetical protein DINM_006609 [Dirofilaria immitis]|nr:hypothetical protein [Dirofilaria immitis]
MCLSFVGQFVFGILMVITLALTAISMFLPGLQQLKNAIENTGENLKHFRVPKEFDLFDSFCRFATTNNMTINRNINSIDFCKHWFHELEDWEKIVAIFMCLSAITEVITICWTIITCLSCSCRKICLQLLPILSLIVALSLTAAITIFAMNNHRIMGILIIL